ncbi:MAG: universal stress protein [Solirubrobacteraceae bacterium]|nr:universal stress protein [Solirubrobacteraceae bacterium]
MNPFRTIVVGVDGRDGGRDATAFAAALGPDELILVAVRPDPWAVMPGAAPDPVDAQEQAARDLEAASIQTGVVEADRVVVTDKSPARALQQVAEDRGADLVVVGSAHRGAIGRLAMGDVSRGVLQGAPCPVAVVPRGVTGAAPASVGVGYDGTPEAQAALALASAWAQDRQARLKVQAAFTPPVATGAYAYVPPTAIDVGLGHLEHLLERVADTVPGDPDCQVMNGPAGIVLRDLSDHVDLLVVGSRGWGPIRRVAVGSTSDYLTHHAHCPVVVVPRPSEE